MGEVPNSLKLFQDAPLITDFYEMTMAEAYFREGIGKQAIFDISLRDSGKRGYYIAAGINAAVEFAKTAGFEKSHIEYLSSLGLGDDFLSYISKNSGGAKIEAVKEGEVIFPGEPILKVCAPLPQAQLLETALLNIVGFQTMIATKASRVCGAAAGRRIVEFGLRRAQGFDAGLWASYSSYIGGCSGTSNLLAGKMFGMPVSGTVGHSYIMAHENENDAFEKWAQYSKNPVFLIDTYDTIKGAKAAAEIAKKIKGMGKQLSAVRIDSKNSSLESRQVRKLLDGEGLGNVKIIISGGLDEYEIVRFLKEGGVADSFGVGTNMVTSNDMPSLDITYKLAQIDGNPVMKKTAGKESMPGDKQVFREIKNGAFACDIVGLKNEEIDGFEKLLHEYPKGKGINWKSAANDAKEYAHSRVALVGADIKKIEKPGKYKVGISKQLKRIIYNI